MFKVGDTVRNVAADVVGVVVETDGDTVYIEQSNGCEVDFNAAALVLEDAYQARHDPSARDDAGARQNDQIYDTVVGQLYPAIVELGRLRHARVERVPGVAPRSWDDLSSLRKLNAVSEATDVPVKTWLDAARPGAEKPLGPLQLSILAAASRKP